MQGVGILERTERSANVKTNDFTSVKSSFLLADCPPTHKLVDGQPTKSFMASNELPRGYWRWEPHEDAIVKARKASGARHKVIARELGRTPASVNNRVLYLRSLDQEAA